MQLRRHFGAVFLLISQINLGGRVLLPSSGPSHLRLLSARIPGSYHCTCARLSFMSVLKEPLAGINIGLEFMKQYPSWAPSNQADEVDTI